MNPLTQVKRTQVINQKEALLGIGEGASWHAKFKDSAYVFVGGIPYDLTEGDLLAVFAQYVASPGLPHCMPSSLPLPSPPHGIAAAARSDEFLTFRRYGEVVDVNLVRDKGTGKSKGFAFVAYEDQRSTVLAVGKALSPIFSRVVGP
jgi:RNA-binding motif protein, X-linked 2